MMLDVLFSRLLVLCLDGGQGRWYLVYVHACALGSA